MNVGRKGGPGLNLNGVGNACGGLNDGRVCSKGHDIMDHPDVATEGLNAATSR